MDLFTLHLKDPCLVRVYEVGRGRAVVLPGRQALSQLSDVFHELEFTLLKRRPTPCKGWLCPGEYQILRVTDVI